MIRILGLEIKRAEPRWIRQKDLFFKCTKCGNFTKLRRCDDGKTILSVLYDITALNRIELECPCGGMVTIASQETVDEIVGPVEWEKIDAHV